MLELAQKKGLEPQSTSLESFQKKFVLTRPLTDLNSVIEHFDLFRRVLDRPEVLERVAYEVVEDCYKEGTRWVELRFSPTFVCMQSRLSWEDALQSFELGMNRALLKYPEMRAGLICIATREYGIEQVAKTVEFFLRRIDRFIGLDLAGHEVRFPCHLFQDSFQKAREKGAKITIHAGEASGPENIWEAIELLGARRIGHGISCVKDSKLMEHLAKNKICLEMCPTSNWITNAVENLEEHPLPKILRAGIPVCINTDDPCVFGATLPREVEICQAMMGMSREEIERCFEHARSASFLNGHS